MHQNSAGASENMQADYKARNALSIHDTGTNVTPLEYSMPKEEYVSDWLADWPVDWLADWLAD